LSQNAFYQACDSILEGLMQELQKDEYVWKLVCGKYQSLVAAVKDANGMLLLEDKEKIEKWEQAHK